MYIYSNFYKYVKVFEDSKWHLEPYQVLADHKSFVKDGVIGLYLSGIGLSFYLHKTFDSLGASKYC